MNDSALHHLHKIRRQWSYHAGNGVFLWQLMFPGTGQVVGQKRDPESHVSSFFCLDAATGAVLCDDFVLMQGGDKDIPAGGGWMVGLETTLGELVFCHAYLPESPEHLGLWAVNLPERNVLWSRPDLVFAANLETSLLMYRHSVFAGFPEREYFLVDPVTGRDLENLGADHEKANALRYEAESEEVRQGLVLPGLQSCPAGKAVTGNSGKSCSGGLSPYHESIVLGELKIEGFHESLSDSCWMSRIRIFLGEDLVYNDLIAVNARRPQLNNFLIKDRSLYYIKNNGELISVGLL